MVARCRDQPWRVAGARAFVGSLPSPTDPPGAAVSRAGRLARCAARLPAGRRRRLAPPRWLAPEHIAPEPPVPGARAVRRAGDWEVDPVPNGAGDRRPEHGRSP